MARRHDGARAARVRLRCTRGDAPAAVADAVRDRARALGLHGWVRADAAAGEAIAIHAEGDPAALDTMLDALRADADDATGTGVEIERVRVEGHEQFAVRGVRAGAFVVAEHQATAHHFDLRLQVGEVMRSWAVPKGPSLDPAVKRFAVAAPDHAVDPDGFEGRTGGGGAIVWDRGGYEQGGRVPWPQALERGHAVFVLHGVKLRGGFALQRTTRPGSGSAGHGPHPPGRERWLLVKRRDEHARPGSDVTADAPESVVSGRTLAQLLAGD